MQTSIRQMHTRLGDLEDTSSKISLRSPLPRCRRTSDKYMQDNTYNDAVLPNFDMVPNGRGLYNGIRTYMHMVSYLHGVIIEVPSIGLVRRPSRHGPSPV